MSPHAGTQGKETAIMNMALCFVNIERALEYPEPTTKDSSHHSLARTDHLARPATKVPARALTGPCTRKAALEISGEQHSWETSGEAWRRTSGRLYSRHDRRQTLCPLERGPALEEVSTAAFLWHLHGLL